MINQFLKRIKEGYEDPKTITLRAIFWLNKYRHDLFKVLDEDWKYLIILDACRYDVFKEINEIPGKLEKRYSAGTHTIDWALENFRRNSSSIVYVSGNPQISRVKLKEKMGTSNPFYHLEEVWDYGWVEELDTVPPKILTESALDLIEKYPEKRMIIHYNQPHYPYIGNPKLTVDWEEINENPPNQEDWIKAYVGNLELVLEEVEDLVGKIESEKTVISADHGETFGEYGLYKHPPKLYLTSLLEVPYLKVD